ncbi:PGAP1-like alpha/beta domain-containing protein [Vibrio salinus]|uniref:PGAP1-like alpha/beta domain-containing protein n=1 Tax=Vibrio salinus TaxID=2899784 RepID=UPI001E4BA670|nr:alpha/beta hydrolase [Vibrio salinus]MCE0495647.1 alpha/beta hydrolase [Vibrio salinus]
MKKTVIIVHGLYMNALMMKWLENRLRRMGYNTRNFNYTTRNYSPLTLHKLHQFRKDIKDEELLFLGHSMGGLVIHQYLTYYNITNKEIKIVTLGTPFNGSTLARLMSDKMYSSWLFGKESTEDILTSGIIRRSNINTGCIIGTRNYGLGRIFNKLQDGDGTVTYKDAHANWATDETFVRSSHMGLLMSPKVIKLTDRFFKFSHF